MDRLHASALALNAVQELQYGYYGKWKYPLNFSRLGYTRINFALQELAEFHADQVIICPHCGDPSCRPTLQLISVEEMIKFLDIPRHDKLQIFDEAADFDESLLNYFDKVNKGDN